MVVYSYQRGHKIYYNDDIGEWVYSDDDSPATIERPCIRCGEMPTKEGHDACLGELEGVKSACCGHGIKPPIVIRPRVVYEEVNDCNDCPYNKDKVCWRLGKYLHDICFEKDCRLPYLSQVEKYLRYVGEDNSLSVCGNCRYWEYLGYAPGYECDIGFCMNDDVSVNVACECTRKGCDEFSSV